MGSLASSSVLGGSGQGIDSIIDFLLSEAQFVVTLSSLNLVDVIVFCLFIPD